MIPLYKVFMPEKVGENLTKILHSGYLTYGEHSKNFESKLQSFVGNPYILTVSCNSVYFALNLLNIKEGDEVIASPMSCLATNQPVVYNGASIIWADIDPNTGSLSPDDVKTKITPNTKAVIHYHWGGYPGHINEINNLAKQKGMYVIEDASESFGAEYKGNKLGNTDSDIVCYSFTPVRLPNAIDGGGLAFKDSSLYTKACLMRDYGIDRTTFRDKLGEISESCDITMPADGCLLNNVSGFVGACQMDYVEELYSRQRENAKRWSEYFADRKSVRPLDVKLNSNPCYWVYTILSDNRDNLLKEFRDKGYYASKMHLRNDIYSVFNGLPKDLPGVNEFAIKQLNIPCGWWFSNPPTPF